METGACCTQAVPTAVISAPLLQQKLPPRYRNLYQRQDEGSVSKLIRIPWPNQHYLKQLRCPTDIDRTLGPEPSDDRLFSPFAQNGLFRIVGRDADQLPSRTYVLSRGFGIQGNPTQPWPDAKFWTMGTPLTEPCPSFSRTFLAGGSLVTDTSPRDYLLLPLDGLVLRMPKSSVDVGVTAAGRRTGAKSHGFPMSPERNPEGL
ncbi:hypothetical protein PG993_008622 [Apiospora rasikravindrae]|uniref:Uncharacterized protein n=1 Tax=Apiospora rasikravindrae TaxID=990691 RepID=A0ABR1T0V5_9PEZI